MAQDRGASVRADAATLEAPTTSSAPSTYPTEAARRTAFREDFTPELTEPVEANIQGSVPGWLHGSFVRNGPGTFSGMKHLFDGYAMLAKFEFENGSVKVSHKYVQTEAYKAFRQTGKMQFPEFGTTVSPLKSMWLALLGFTDNSSVNVVPTPDGKQLISLTESVAGTFRLDMDLNTLGQLKFEDGVKGLLTTAHPTLLPDGSMINLTSGFGTHYTVFRQNRATNVREEIAQVPLCSPPTPSWIHDFPVTENYAIVPETPIFFNLKAALFGGADYVMFDWKPEQRTILHLVNLKTGAVTQFDAPPYFTFHYINSFETADGASLCFDFSRFEDPDFMNRLMLDNLRGNKRPIAASPVVRITVPLDGSSSSAKLEPLMKDDSYNFCELPRVNPHYKGKEYRYAYAVSAKLPASFGNSLAKFDVEEGSVKQWHEAGCIPVEPLMVPRPGAQDEDDGVVLSVVTGADGKSFLLVLDASSFQELARAHLPHGIPYGFHGTFVHAD
ncbi:carotenoid oxygenase [Coccomyxa subellipsoidea C-169]|uniref:Carotenoid oxygenase n=1 Tax=Coccomyxa subellipsoidea (strain C-169) TaxID=574566 RepID=I0YP26_COCSC|nr:carotenoid oxygenase [Coccomyxa subellipsoidea C-169]EIE20145.1 carotenoid oxygenase [Coccomyxa subellipsoidea C-169]|eukprot:XP_005644689.1 carotenoid oxygenase [Coccomyxa subellipsoidea C-169]